MFDGRSLAAALMLGADGIWVGTRFVTAKESEAPRGAKDRFVYGWTPPCFPLLRGILSIINAGFDSTIKTLIFTGRPLRILSTPYIARWESHRQDEIRELTAQGILPIEHDLEILHEQGKLTEEIEEQSVKRYLRTIAVF